MHNGRSQAGSSCSGLNANVLGFAHRHRHRERPASLQEGIILAVWDEPSQPQAGLTRHGSRLLSAIHTLNKSVGQMRFSFFAPQALWTLDLIRRPPQLHCKICLITSYGSKSRYWAVASASPSQHQPLPLPERKWLKPPAALTWQ